MPLACPVTQAQWQVAPGLLTTLPLPLLPLRVPLTVTLDFFACSHPCTVHLPQTPCPPWPLLPPSSCLSGAKQLLPRVPPNVQRVCAAAALGLSWSRSSSVSSSIAVRLVGASVRRAATPRAQHWAGAVRGAEGGAPVPAPAPPLSPPRHQRPPGLCRRSLAQAPPGLGLAGQDPFAARTPVI